MNVLIIGEGGRESAILHQTLLSPKVSKVFMLKYSIKITITSNKIFIIINYILEIK